MTAAIAPAERIFSPLFGGQLYRSADAPFSDAAIRLRFGGQLYRSADALISDAALVARIFSWRA
jgi:hypothetical protein